MENHFGADVYLTRKGAISAREGEHGIIPGSMGAKSFIVRGKGNDESFHSCSHGAGRVMSRGEAFKRFTVEDHTAYQVKGPADQLEPLLDVLSDFYQHSVFDPGDLENERSVIHEEIAMVHDQPGQWLEDLTSAAVPVIGRPRG